MVMLMQSYSNGRFILAVELSKNQNIGPHIRNAAAFGSEFIAIIGANKFCRFGSKNSKSKVAIRHYFTWEEFFDSLETLNIKINGPYGIGTGIQHDK